MSAILDAPLPRHRFSRAQYDRMIEAGVFGPEERLELLDGEIVDMAPQRGRHATAVTLVHEALRAFFGADYTLRIQLPFSLDDRSEPEPDIAVVPGRPRDYRDNHPASAVLIVEVADTTLAYDRIRKLAAYARAGIPEYWILDIEGETLEACRRPVGDSYGDRRILKPVDRIAPAAAASGDIAVADLMP